MNPKYRFFLQLNGGGEKIAANPVFKDDMTLDYELESNQRFYRAKLSGKFSFVRQDFATIMGAAFDTVYYFYIEKSNDWGQTWTQYYKSMFMRTDCTINTDDQIISVQPNPIDQYNDVLAGLEKEYNLISLTPEIERITLKKRPLIQIYINGDNFISCFLNGLTWEQDAESVTLANELEQTYHFARNEYIAQYVFTKDETKPIPTDLLTYPFVGTYEGTATNAAGYRLTGGASADKKYIYDSDGTLLYKWIFLEQTGNTFIPINAAYSRITFSFTAFPIWARYLLDVETINDLRTYPLPEMDIVANNRNYKYAIGYGVSGIISVSTNFSDTPTEFGLWKDNKYYKPPYSMYGQKFYPIARSKWGDYSIWFSFHFLDDLLEVAGRKTYTLRDSYPASSVLSVLLQQFAPGITHEATPEYSQFLYNRNNPINGYSFRLFVTPKSNILVGDYQTPVQKAPTTLQQFLDMLRNTFQLYWHIEDNKLRIEHISWYRDGGTYAGRPVVGYDLTTLENVRNGKKWAFGTSEYTFDKEDMPERYQFKWADDATEPFEGQPIQVVSKYVQAGKIEKINIGGFSSDIDLMLLNPELFSQDGFALLAATQGANGMELPFVRRDVGGSTYYLQNGLVAMVNLQPQYWLYDMPARNLIVNGGQISARGIQRRKSQTLTLPVGDDDPDLLQLVKTSIGNGQYKKISINLSSRTAEATLKYDTE